MEEAKSNVGGNAVKLLGDVLLPGASLMMDGKILAGGAHTIVSTLARVALGPFGVALVAANAYSTSVTGRGLLAQVAQVAQRGKKPAAPAEAAPDYVAPVDAVAAKP